MQCVSYVRYQCATFCPQAFSIIFQKAVERATPSENLQERVTNLMDSITFSVYQYTTRGLFECDKLTYLTQLTLQVRVDEHCFQRMGPL